MKLKQEPLVTHESSLKMRSLPLTGGLEGSSLANWGIWLLGFFLSMLPLLIIPYFKFLEQEKYTGWRIDIFGNMGIIMITASLALAAIFEGITRNKKINIPQGCLLVIAFTCYTLHSAMTIKIEDVLSEQSILKTTKFAAGNMFLFFTMFICSLWSFGLWPRKPLPNLAIHKIFKKG
jgi:hypothetical protein